MPRAILNQKAGIPTFPRTAWGMAYGALSATLTAVARSVPWTFDTRPAYLLSLAYLRDVVEPETGGAAAQLEPSVRGWNRRSTPLWILVRQYRRAGIKDLPTVCGSVHAVTVLASVVFRDCERSRTMCSTAPTHRHPASMAPAFLGAPRRPQACAFRLPLRRGE